MNEQELIDMLNEQLSINRDMVDEIEAIAPAIRECTIRLTKFLEHKAEIAHNIKMSFNVEGADLEPYFDDFELVNSEIALENAELAIYSGQIESLKERSREVASSIVETLDSIADIRKEP